MLGLHMRSLTALSGHSAHGGVWRGSPSSGDRPGNAHLDGSDVCVQVSGAVFVHAPLSQVVLQS